MRATCPVNLFILDLTSLKLFSEAHKVFERGDENKKASEVNYRKHSPSFIGS